MSDFATSIDRLLTQVRHWEESRWSAPAATGTKADLAFTLARRLADLAAQAEAQHAPGAAAQASAHPGAETRDHPVREVPRLHDLVLPDQLRVLADDLLAASPSDALLAEATTAVDDVRYTI